MVMGMVDGCVLRELLLRDEVSFFRKRIFVEECRRSSWGMLWLNPSLKPGSRRAKDLLAKVLAA